MGIFARGVLIVLAAAVCARAESAGGRLVAKSFRTAASGAVQSAELYELHEGGGDSSLVVYRETGKPPVELTSAELATVRGEDGSVKVAVAVDNTADFSSLEAMSAMKEAAELKSSRGRMAPLKNTLTAMLGGGQTTSDGASGMSGSVFYRMPVLQNDDGSNLGVSVGVGFLSTGIESTVVSRSSSYGHYYGQNARFVHTIEKDKPGTTMVELARVDYETSHMYGYSLYGGVGAGYAWSDSSVNTVDKTEVLSMDGTQIVSNSVVLDSIPGTKWAEAFATTFAGVKMDAGPLLDQFFGPGGVKDIVLEYERAFGASGRSNAESLRLGVDWNF